MMKNYPQTRKSSWTSSLFSEVKYSIQMVALLPLLMMLMPMRAWAADKDLETTIIDGKSFYVLRSNDDWKKFRDEVQGAAGNADVNAIMDDDFTVTLSVGLDGWPYRGTFDGNGHTLNVNIQSGSDSYAAPFPVARDYTFKNLHVTGTVSGGQHSSGLVGSSTAPENHFDNCWVSVTVTGTKAYVGGFIGHGHDGNHIINNCYFDGTLIANNSSDSHGGSFIGWEDGGTQNKVTNCLEKGTYNQIRHAGFNYSTNAPYGNSAENGNNRNNWSYLNWNEMRGNVVGSKSVTDLVATLGNKNWQVADGRAVPVMNSYPKADEVDFSLYDIIPGVEEGDEGMLKIPFSCNQIIKWVEASYTDEYGKTKKLGRMTLDKNSYSGFLRVPATEAHRDLKLTVKMVVGKMEVTYDAKSDAVMHNPRQLKAEMMGDVLRSLTNAGAVQLQWVIHEPAYKDVMDSDPFIVMRSLTGRMGDMETIGSVDFDNKVSTYTYKDSTLITTLTAEYIDKGIGIPLVRYCVVRASTQQLWGFEMNPTAAYVQPQMATLSLLAPTDAKAAWSNEKERKVKVTWGYKKNDQGHNYVWDDRAEMALELQLFRRDGSRADSIVTLLSNQQIQDGTIEVALPRSCVNYQIRLLVNSKESPIGRGTGDIFVTLGSTDDLNAFIKRVNEGENGLNAVMTADIVSKTWDFSYSSEDKSPSMIAYYADKPYTGNFNGNGHLLTMKFSNGVSRPIQGIAPFRYVANGAVIANLNTAGTLHSLDKFIGGIVAYIGDGEVFIEKCRSSMRIENIAYYKDGTSAGLVGLIDTSSNPFGKCLRISDCLYDGTMDCREAGGIGGFIGFRRETAFTMLTNCYFNPTAITNQYNSPANATFMRNGNNDIFYGILQDCYYKTTYGEAQGQKSDTAPDNWCWNKGVPAVEQKQFSKPVSHTETMVTMPADKFYYESLGKIDEESLEATPLQSSVLLEWKNVDESPVDYYEVWRNDMEVGEGFKCIATQLNEMRYEDKETSPVHNYEYRVRGVNDCEGKTFIDTKVVKSHCLQTGTLEGYLCFADGTGIPGEDINITSKDGKRWTVKTDESGFFRQDELPYINGTETSYNVMPNMNGYKSGSQTVRFGTKPGDNKVTDVKFLLEESVKFSGFVLYNGTSIPVQGVSFLVDGHEVHNAAGKVVTDHEGKFAFHMTKDTDHNIQAVKEGHWFYQNGFYHEDDDTTKIDYNFSTSKAGIYFYDDTRVKLIGRVAGGKDQGEIPLGNSLSRNNLGKDLEMVFTLEGDNTSRLVWDIQDNKKKERDEVFKHTAHDKKHDYQTKVHTTLNRMVVRPDVNTGEFEVLLPPVKWKIQQITAKGYATLFQDGQTGDVIDLTDSLTEHIDHYEGSWKNAEKVTVSKVDVKYYAQYKRIYHSPVIIDYKQIGYENFDYFGDRYYNAKNLAGDSEKVPLCYPVRKKDWPEGKKDSLEVVYTFGHPVFNIERNYPIKISAVEKYYFNNDTKNDTVDVIRLSGGEVVIHNSMVSSTHRDMVPLDSVGEAIYNLRAAQTPYMLTGEDAVRTVTMTLAMDGTHYEANPLKAYVLNQYALAGAKDILTINKPILIDILRDPPGGGSSATLSKGSTLKYAHEFGWSVKGGLNITFDYGHAMTNLQAMGIGVIVGMIYSANSKLTLGVDLVVSGSGKEAWSYTMTNNVDISTSSDITMVGADADVYIGAETAYILKPTVAIRAIPEGMWKQLAGQREAGRMVEIARGYNEEGDTLHLVRDEMVGIGAKVNGTFMHSQQYIINQLIPGLWEQSLSLLFHGSKSDAQKIADETGKPVYLSLREPGDPHYGLVNTKTTVEKGESSWEYVFNTTIEKPQDGINYLVVRPKDSTSQEDQIAEFCQSMLYWAAMIAQNEKEKLDATELVRTFDVDGGSPMSYSEDFSSEYSATGDIQWPWGGGLGKIAATALKSVFDLLNNKSHSELREDLPHFGVEMPGYKYGFTFGPIADYSLSSPDTEGKGYNRKESFTISMDKRSHLVFDVYRAKTKVDDPGTSDGRYDVFVNRNYNNLTSMVSKELKHDSTTPVVHAVKSSDLRFAKSFVYRTRGGATCRPWEGERTTNFYRAGVVLDERTKKIENPVITMDKQSVSGVPYGEPARFKLYLANESEQPEAPYPFFDLYFDETSNPKGAKIFMDGMPLTGNARIVQLNVGEVTEKTIEVYAGEDFDYENLRLKLMSQNDPFTYQYVSFDVHYLQTAGDVAITTPGDKWIMNTDAQQEEGKGWYMPVVISGFDKNQHNFDHIEFQYKESTRGDDYWTNLCGFYADSTIYVAASGTKEMIPENGHIITRFFGEGQVMEKAYDLRAVLFCRNGNSFLTNESKVLTGVKDTRRPQLFGNPEPKDGVLGTGDNIIFNFSEAIEHNYLQATTNFEVKGETNEASIQEAPSLQFDGDGYAQSEARRNFANKNVTIEVMIKPDDTGKEMPIFSHGTDGKKLQLWLTADKRLRAVVNDRVLESDSIIRGSGFQRVALVLNNDSNTLSIYSKNLDDTLRNVTYSGYGPIIFGSTNEPDVSRRRFYKGRMLQGRVWNRAMDINLLNAYGNQLLTGYEMGLTDYYPMNEGRGDYATDLAQGAHLKLNGTDWAQPRGMSLKLDGAEDMPIKGLQLRESFFKRSDEEDYTLMFWFKTTNAGRGALLCNGSGRSTDVGAADKFFIGFESDTLKYRSNGHEYPLGTGLSNDRWHHYAMTVNRAHQVASIYVDNSLKAQFSTEWLGGMVGDFYLGNMVWQEEGGHNDVVHQQNALTGHIDGLALFEQALPVALIERYTAKAPGGAEKGLITYVDFDRQERQKNGDISLQPYVLNKKVRYDNDGKETDQHDSVFVKPVADIVKHVDTDTGAPMQAHEELRNLNFSYVGRNNQILVNIDELDKRINKRMVYVTVSDIPDLNGNYLASPATAAVFIDRNPLRWAQKTYKDTMTHNNDDDYSFDINIVNNSGASHTYMVENMPKWLNISKASDIIEAKSEQTLTFSIGKDTNVGTYDDIIYLTDENGLAEPLMLNITVEGQPHGWEVDADMKQFSMNIVARVEIGDDIVTDSRDVVGVFDKTGRCMGVGHVNYDAASAESLVYLTVHDSMTVKRVLDFRLWHYETGKTMTLTPPDTVKFEPETFVGTTKDPLLLRASDQYIQRIDLYPGWNWISLNVINDDYYKVKKLLNWFSWKEGDMLTDETNNISLLYHNGEWLANKGTKQLEDLTLTVSQSYRVKVANYVKVELTGSAVQTEGNRTITVKQGWNSIGYTPLVNLPVSTALSDYLDDAEEGDVVKSKTAFAMFSKGAKGSREWQGNLKYMKPGEGYMIYRKREGETSFIYPFYEASTTFFEETSLRRAPMTADFADNMSLTAVAEDVELLEGDKLIAFAGTRMVGETLFTCSEEDAENGQIFYMTIAGDQKASLSFAIERNGEMIAITDEVMTYEANAVSGLYNEPTSISFLHTDQLPQHGWYTLQGIQLPAAPTERGMYIYNGRIQFVR